VVVGGGPAGAVCARELARSGLDVSLVDRASFPRVKPCAGWITPEVFPLLGWRHEHYDDTLQPFRGIRVHHRGRIRVTNYGVPVSHGILRREFDHRILREAAAAGASVHESAPVRRIDLDRDGVSIETPARTLRSRVVVGAGGHFCPVAARVRHRRGERVIAALETETRVGAAHRDGDDEPFLDLIPLPDLTGYAWIVRKGDWLNVGIGGYCRDLKERWLTLLTDLGARGLVDPVRLDPHAGHAYRVYDSTTLNSAVGDRYLLTGDAAGLAHDYSGEGIRAAIESGLDAAAVLREALSGRGTPGRDALSPYLDRLRARWGPDAGLAARATVRLAGPLLRPIAGLVIASGILRRRLIAEGMFGLHPVS
jgi:menaquinone-9 beta-reductase